MLCNAYCLPRVPKSFVLMFAVHTDSLLGLRCRRAAFLAACWGWCLAGGASSRRQRRGGSTAQPALQSEQVCLGVMSSLGAGGYDARMLRLCSVASSDL